jgi:hypothetical protein
MFRVAFHPVVPEVGLCGQLPARFAEGEIIDHLIEVTRTETEADLCVTLSADCRSHGHGDRGNTISRFFDA